MTEIKQELIAQMDVSEVDTILVDGIDGAVYDEILIKWQLVSDTIVEYDILYAKINGLTSYIDALKFNNDNEYNYNSTGGTSFEVMSFYGTTQHNIRGELSIDARLNNAQRIADGYCSYKNLESYMNVLKTNIES